VKKNYRVYLIVVSLALLIAMIGIFNRNMQNETTANVVDYYRNEEILIKIDLNKVHMSEFSGLMKKKVGTPEEHLFYGAMLKDILNDMDIELKNDAIINIVAEDNYVVTLTYEEINEENNVYLVTKMDGEVLKNIDEDHMMPMIVILKDEFSTRWVKYIKLIEEK
jgi:hypothetical protein